MAIDVYDILTVDLLKNTMLAGIDLTLDDGSAYPDDLFEQTLAQAISTMEEELEITINPFSTKKERHDLDSDQARGFYPLQLDRRPVRSVEKLNISYGNYAPVQIPDAWINITSPEAGSVHLIPTAESVGQFNFNNVLPMLIDPLTTYGNYQRVPGYFSYDYTSGFNFIEKTITVTQNTIETTGLTYGEVLTDKPNFIFEIVDDGNGNIVGAPVPKIKAFGLSDDGFSISTSITPLVGDMTIKVKIHTMPSSLVKCILYIAAMLPLDTAGDLLLGAGIGQFSLAVDGLSQNIASTSSATSSGYGARTLSYERQLKMTLKALRKKYTVPKLAGGF